MPCRIAGIVCGTGSDVTLVWCATIACIDLFTARLICVSPQLELTCFRRALALQVIVHIYLVLESS